MYSDRAKYLEYQREYRERMRAHRRLVQAAYHAAHRESRNAASKARRDCVSKEAIREQNAAYYAANKHTGRWAESNRRSYVRNKEAYRHRDAVRRAREKSELTPEERWMLKEAYALAKLRECVCGGRWEVDHVVPLAAGGLHTPYNVQVVPRGFNRRKGAASALRFFHI